MKHSTQVFIKNGEEKRGDKLFNTFEWY